jgi:hypothetical protein
LIFQTVQVQKNSNRITPLAGISFIDNEFTRSGSGKLIDNEVDKIVSRCGYQYSDIFRAWFNIFFCGGYCTAFAPDTRKYP